MNLTLVRFTVSDRGAFGVLVMDGEPFAVTIEHTYQAPGGDHTLQTKIPEGTYHCVRRMFHRGGYETFQILVPGHTDILFHVANFYKDVDGCVGVGESYRQFGPRFGDYPGIADSKAGFGEFQELTAGFQMFELRVVDVVGQVI